MNAMDTARAGVGASAPALSALRKAWLREIGVDRRLFDGAAPGASPAAGAVAVTPTTAPATVVAAPQAPAPTVSAAPPATADAQVASSPPQAAPRVPVAPRPVAPAAGAPEAAAEARRSLDPAALATADLAGLARHAGECEACGLADVRGMTVFGSGCAQQPAWLVLGEAPTGEDERIGEPFQGRQGRLLHAMLRAGGLDPATLYFTHLVKCRPLGNRPPSTDEIDACRALLLAQFVQVRPQRLLLLGRTAVSALLGAQADFEQWQGRSGRWHWPASAGAEPEGWPAEGLPLLVTHHPGALLMRPQHKALAWRDICRARQLMDR